MAIYRQVQTTFWTDTKVADDFTPEDKYFYLYLFTNPHTNLSGCYEVGKRQMSNETGYSVDTIDRLIKRMSEIHRVIAYSDSTKEILLLNWWRYNWTSSERFRKSLLNEIDHIKDNAFRQYIMDAFNRKSPFLDTVSEKLDTVYEKTDTVSEILDTVSVNDITDTVTVTDTVSNNNNKNTDIDIYKENHDLIDDRFSDDMKVVINDWLTYKRERREGYKPKGLQMFLSQVENSVKAFGEQAVTEVIHNSMASGYQGITFNALKKHGNGNRGSAYIDRIDSRIDIVDDWLKGSEQND